MISGDDAFLIEAGPAFSDRFRTRSIDNAAALPDSSEDKNWFVVLDATAEPDARAAVIGLEQRIGTRPIIVVVSDGDTTDWRFALAHGTVVDAVPRQELQQPRFAAALTKAEGQMQEAPAFIPAGLSSKRTPPRRLTLIVAGVVALAVLAWLWIHHGSGEMCIRDSRKIAVIARSVCAEGDLFSVYICGAAYQEPEAGGRKVLVAESLKEGSLPASPRCHHPARSVSMACLLYTSLWSTPCSSGLGCDSAQ